MAETHKKIYPGNFVTHLNAHALPNADFTKNKRPVGDPQDRHHQALLFTPGWIAVRKVGYAHITGQPGPYDIILPSPDLRGDDKPRADIKGLYIPAGAYAVRAGFRVPALSAQPGYTSSAPELRAPISGIHGLIGEKLMLGSAMAAAEAINGSGITTAGLAIPGTPAVGATADVPVGSTVIAAAFGTPQQITAGAGLTHKLHVTTAAGTVAGTTALTTTIPGGAYIACELVYILPEEVADLDDLHIGGATTSGNTP